MSPETITSAQEWIKQSVLAGRFYKELGYDSKKAYIATLPPFPEKPGTYDNLGLTIPLIVETRLPWQKLAELAGITVTPYLLKTTEESGWDKDPKIVEISRKPYTTWVENGDKYIEIDPAIKQQLALEERRGGIFDALALLTASPEEVKKRAIDVAGPEAGSPYFYYWYGETILDWHPSDYTLAHLHPLICGKEIKTF